MFKKKLLWKVFGPKKDEVSWQFRTLHDKEVNVLNRLPSIVKTMKSRKLKWTR